MPNEISQIKTPDNTTYTVKDTALAATLDSAKGSYSSVANRINAIGTTLSTINTTLEEVL